MVEKQKTDVKKVKSKMIYINIIATLIWAGVSCSTLQIGHSSSGTNSTWWFLLFGLHTVLGVTLILSVIGMKRAVLETKIAQPNNRFVVFHVFNFSTLIVLTFIVAIMTIVS